MKNVEPVDNSDLKHLLLFVYLIPIVGFFPSLWTLYRRGNKAESSDLHRADKQELAISRLSVTLAGSWLLGYILFGFGAETSDFLTLRLLVLNSFWTSGYFSISVWLMVRLFSRKSIRLPGFSRLADRVLAKYLS